MTTTYIPTTPLIGSIDFNSVVTAATLGAPFSTSTLPSVTIEQQLGQINQGYATNALTNTNNEAGWCEMIFLAIPVSTTVTPRLLYRYNAATFSIVVVPTAVSSSALSGAPVALAINTVSSNSTAIQYTWFQVGGRQTALTSNLGTTKQPDVSIYVSSTTAGRVRTTGSIFRTILGARTANTTTVSAAVSLLPVYLYRPIIGPGS